MGNAKIVDMAIDPTPYLEKFKSDGVECIIGYMSSIWPSGPKCWSPARARALQKSGLAMGIVHEGWGGVNGRGISGPDGLRDGQFCRQNAVLIGAVKGAAVYFAVDTDYTVSQVNALVVPYFTQIRKAFSDGLLKVGVYGSGLVCSTLKAKGLVDYTWLAQSTGWAGYHDWLDKADLVQGRETHLEGADIDTDIVSANAHDAGLFYPYSN